MALDRFSVHPVTTISSFLDVFLITPSDTEDLPEVPRGILIGEDGTLRVLTLRGRDLTIPAGVLAPNIWHPLRISKIYETGTTATNILGGS